VVPEIGLKKKYESTHADCRRLKTTKKYCDCRNVINDVNVATLHNANPRRFLKTHMRQREKHI